MEKSDVVRIVRAGASGTEKYALLALAGEKGLWECLEEDEVLGVLKEASKLTGTLLTVACETPHLKNEPQGEQCNDSRLLCSLTQQLSKVRPLEA